MQNILPLLLFLLWLPALSQAVQACVTVVGQLHCHRVPERAYHVQIQVFDADLNWLDVIDRDDDMGITFSNGTGHFWLFGCAGDPNWLPWMNNMPEPYIRITHRCNGWGEALVLPPFDTFFPVVLNLGNLVLDKNPDFARIGHHQSSRLHY